MGKQLLDEISRQKELMNISEQSIVGGAIGDAIKKGLTNYLQSELTKNMEPEDIMDYIKTHSDIIDSKDQPLNLDKISEKGKALLDNKVFKEKLKDISQSIHIPESAIIKLMNHESKLNPTIVNPIGCVGLIQFCPAGGKREVNIGGKKYSFDSIIKDLGLQMDAIKDFWMRGYNAGKIKSPEDLYLYNFFPLAAGKPDNFVIKSNDLSAKTVAQANPVFNRTLGRPTNTPLTVGDMKRYYRQTGMV